MCNYNVIYMYVHGYLLVQIQYYVLILSQYSIDSTTVSIIAILLHILIAYSFMLMSACEPVLPYIHAQIFK